MITEYFNTANNASAGHSPPTIAQDAFQRVKALIGAFDLDVGRVLDVTLDVFASLLIKNFRFLLKFIRASSWWPEDDLPDVIKWKGQGFDCLPDWALPNSRSWGSGPEEADRLARLQPLQQERDVAFWKRVGEVGMDAFFEIGARHITNYDDVLDLLNTEKEPDLLASKREMNAIKRIRINDRRKWMRDTRMLPPSGNADAAELLGFKLGFYASPARSSDDVMPDNLIFLAAFLIKIGFITLRDLYSHLYPPDDKMAGVKEKLEDEKQERERASRPGGAATNALAMAGALADDSLPVVKTLRDTASTTTSSPKPEGASTTAKLTEDEKEKLPESPDQKISLLKSLLAIGALPEALFILGRFPWLTDLVPDLPEHINRILHHMLSKVYEPLRPLADRSALSEPQTRLGDAAGLPKGTLNRVSAPATNPRRWANLDRPDYGDGLAFKFYWDSWTDNIPVCQTVDDVFLLCSTFLNLSGVKIGHDPELLAKMARIGKESLLNDRSPENESRWIDLLKRLLVPALSLTRKNPGLVNEVFDLLRLFSTSVRYSIYAEWHFGPTARQYDIKNAFDRTRAEAKDVLKRISKTNVRAMGKTLAKVAYGSPGIVLQTAINQMESYDNLIEVFVECSKYFTFLGYDVLTWCLLNALGGAGRNRIQADGMLTSPWLRALSSFAGSVFTRYSMCDPTPVLQYVASELRDGNSTDLELLEQILEEMAGIKSDMAYNEAQVVAMAGGQVLRSQTIIAMRDERHKLERSSKRLAKALTDSGLAGQLLVSIAREQQMYPHHTSSQDAPLKVLANNVDKIHQVFVQYLDALQSNLSTQEFGTSVPDVLSLIRDYGLEPSIAFMIGRISVSDSLAEMDAAKKLEQQESARRTETVKDQSDSIQPVVEPEDIVIADAEDGDQVNGVAQLDPLKTEPGDSETSLVNGDTQIKEEKSDAMEDVIQTEAPSTTDATTTTLASLQASADTEAPFWHPALTSLVNNIPDALGEDLESSISVPFYVTFWTLSLQDIVVDNASYEQELSRQKQLVKQIKNDRSDVTALGVKDREKKLKAINDLIDRLGKEMKHQISAYTQVRNRLLGEKDHWFKAFRNKVEILHLSILQNCFLPRLLLSPLDAHFTFTMLKFLHNNGTPGFRTMHLFDIFLRRHQLAAVIFQCTPRESENLGLFLNGLLRELHTWHADKATYERSAFGRNKSLPGFSRSLVNGSHAPDLLLGYEDFRRLLYKWHNNLCAAFKECFDSTEYMHIRNGVVVLKGIHQYFPAVNFMGAEMLKRAEDLSKTEARDDLKLAGTSLYGNLKRREKSWVMPQAFRNNETAAGTPKPEPSRSGTPQSSAADAPKSLNAGAAEFKPAIKMETEDDMSKPTGAAGDAEDGEIDDEKKADIKAPVPTSKTPSQQAIPSRPAAFVPTKILQRPQSTEPSRATSSTPMPGAHVGTPQPAVASTAAPSVPSIHAPQARGPHALPPRPDSRPTSRPSSRMDRPGDRAVPAPAQDRDRDTYGRLDRPNELARNPSQRERSPGHSSRQRTPERDAISGRRDVRSRDVIDERQSTKPLPRDARQSDRDPPGRPADMRVAPRPRADDDRQSRNPTANMPPPQPSQERPSQHPSENRRTQQAPQATAQSKPNDAVTVDPARAAMIESANQRQQPRETFRAPQIDSRDRPSRGPSPRRDNRPTPMGSEPVRDDRGRGPLPPASVAYETRMDQGSDRAPAGPRHDRSAHPEPPSRRPSSDLFGGQAPRAPQEQGYGRLSQQQESSYGRLNAPDAPPGPRSGPGRGAPPPQPRAVTQSQSQSQNAPPVSPSESRGGPSRPSSIASGPSTPAIEQQSQPTGMHPSRLAQIQPEAVQTAPSQPATPSGPAASRPPAGPPVGTPTGPSPATRGPPSGPAAVAIGNRSDRRFAGLNDHLQGGTDRGATVRGRATRPNGPMMAPSGPAPSQQHAPAQSPRISESTSGPVINPARAARIVESPVAPQGSFAPTQAQAQPSSTQTNDFRIAGRHEESRHPDRRRDEAYRRSDFRPATEQPIPRSVRDPGSRDDYAQHHRGERRDNGGQSIGGESRAPQFPAPEDGRGSQARGGRSVSYQQQQQQQQHQQHQQQHQQGYHQPVPMPEMRSYAAPPDAYGGPAAIGGGGGRPGDARGAVGSAVRPGGTRGPGLQGTEYAGHGGHGHDQGYGRGQAGYGGAGDGRGGYGGGDGRSNHGRPSRDEGPMGRDVHGYGPGSGPGPGPGPADGGRGYDGRKRRGDDMGSMDPKRRRSGQ